jgi:hypothetical protein
MDRDDALAVVDDALAKGRVSAADPAARELQELALTLEAESELPDERFAHELGERVAAGFPHRRRGLPGIAGRSLPRIAPLRGRGLALTGAAASLLIVVGVALSLSGGEPSEPAGTRPLAVETGESRSVAPPPGADASTMEPVPPAAEARVAPGERRRRIERSAELTLAAPEDRLDRVADQIVQVTDRNRGFVLRSSVSSGDDSARGGSFDLRIPAASLQTALRDLSKLGHVRARRQAGQDLTQVFVSISDRLDTARAERRSLLRRLAGADSDSEAEAIRRRLDAVGLRIERLRRELRAMRERTDYAAVTVTLEADGEAGGGGAGGGRGMGDALDDSLGLLEGSLALALRALGVLIPLAIVAGLGWFGGRMLRRRRREAALR